MDIDDSNEKSSSSTTTLSTPSFNTDVASWTPENVAAWARLVLKENGFPEEFADKLKDQYVNGVTLIEMAENTKAQREDQLRSIGILFGPVTKLAAAIHELCKAHQAQKTFLFGPPIMPNSSVYAMPPPLLSTLANCAEIGGCYLFEGGFRSGKTSHLHFLIQKTTNYFPLMITLTPGLAEQKLTLRRFLELLSEKLPTPITELTALSQVYQLYPSFFRNKPILLLIDEFQATLELDNKSKEVLLLQIKAVVGGDKPVKTVIGVGSFSLSDLLDDNLNFEHGPLSPFSLSRTVFMVPSSTTDIKTFFIEWAHDKQIIIDEILDHIVYLTAGYAGLVGYIAFTLQDYLSGDPSISMITLPMWFHQQPKFLKQIASFQQFSRVFNFILRGDTDVHVFVIKFIIANSSPFTLQTKKDIYIAHFLANYGILTYDPQTDQYNTSAPLLRQLILENTYQHKMNLLQDLNIQFEQEPKLWLSNILEHLDPANLMQPAAQKAIKLHGAYDQFPTEYVLQAELFAIIREALRKSGWSVIVEARAKGRADIFIQNGLRVVIETKSAKYYHTEDELFKDVNQASRYGKELNAEIILLLNFVPDGMNAHAPEWTPKSVYKSSDNKTVYVVNVSLNLRLTGSSYFCNFVLLPSS